MSTTLITQSPVTTLNTPPTFGDWRDDLHQHGYAVIKGAIPHNRARSYQQRAFSWLHAYNPAFSATDPTTWRQENLPVISAINTIPYYGVSHEAFVWDARQEPGVLDAFSTLWGTDELLASFDALNVTFPGRPDRPPRGSWPHVDQSPFRRGLHCVQGIINLSQAGPRDGGLLVYPGSHALLEEFFETQTAREDWLQRDFYRMSEEDMAWFAGKGVGPVKVCAEPGDLIVWDSRTVHYGAEPEEDSTQVRTVVYACYTPAKWASPDALEKKRECFEKWAGTTHWPHDNIVYRPNEAIREDGTRDPKDREEPVEKPVLTERLLKLAGMKPY